MSFVGRLWIHSAAKEPTEEDIKSREDHYTAVYAMDGVEVEFPKHYPVSALLGCVEVVGVVTKEEFAQYYRKNQALLPRSLTVEECSSNVFLCQKPKR